MVMQVGCAWCKLSAGFYRDLLKANAGNEFHPIAAFPQPVAEGQAFLHRLSLNISDVRETELADLGVDGTPALILVDVT
jgi:hypothetical protein